MFSWLKSYFIGRAQLVKLGNSVSSAINVTSGVPKGGHLSPTLLLLFMNNVKDFFNNSNFFCIHHYLFIHPYLFL